ncbi:aldehyde dehydrogenase family protein [Devosia sp. 63-57]|uniref:aldehyde dehydrogenase family protein n=1 Tax=Devosia sp. 63-57 TaxID=1895751 RepID=UPI00086EFF7B|nr:aldehyde dehydrogenase family protein [Devosia sp. 63-57]ODT47796.1 MAG: aldehyde dehydrogenase [Pelagibacterium sp. SCN 63-126]ODU87223.1 MAG: aldehyde dehydrogenase [Pelagibacterium sp. SCN 63-17]OJX42494.1 MAG: aldehyde dehydrogenase [Devosia sp. 63-57]
MNKIAQIFDSLDYGPAPEAPDQAIAWLDSKARKFGHFIDGQWTRPGKTFAADNPATGASLAEITDGTAEDVDAAVKAARAAFKGWSALSGYERGKYLYAIARMIQKHARLFAVLETMDNGKPIRESRDADIPLAARHFYHHAGWATHLASEFPGMVPYGVCGQIIPWNFPLLMLAWKIAPALAAGNTVVLKPAEFTSLTALLFAEICERVGLPKGVVNIVTGEGDTGAAIVNHPGIDKIAFTGSTEVGKIIRDATAGSGKGLSLELGGKSPYIVFEDADLDSAVEGLVEAIWFNQGQVCCAGSRLLVQESIEERFIAKVKKRMANLRVGDPLDKSVDIGALVAPVQVERIRDLMKRGVAEGAVVYEPDGTLPAKGCFLKPALVTNVSPANTLVEEEIFGPVLVAMSFRTPEEAVALANNTRYGLAATIWSENINLALDIAPKIKAGVVWINGTNNFDAAVGFGGYKESGFGREGGREGMASYLKPVWEKELKPAPVPKPVTAKPANPLDAGHLDQTAKMYIGGKQARPDSAYNRAVLGPSGALIGEVGEGNRKDIRNAVEAARAALAWGTTAAHSRAQILYFLAENLDYRRDEFAARIKSQTGEDGGKEVDLAVERLFGFAGWADKFDGAIHNPPQRMVAAAMVEPLGVLGIVAPVAKPLLGSVALIAPAIAMGNTVVLVPSERSPLSMTDFYQVLETSDMPSGVVNIVTGDSLTLAKTMAEHDGVDGMWFMGSAEASAMVEKASTGNLKQTWTTRGLAYDLADPRFAGDYLLGKATQVKNVWIPYGA